MVGLWADGWFYISSAGLLVSGVLFIFLLGQYRIASEAADVTEVEAGSEKDAQASAIRPVYTPEAAAAPKVVSHADTPAPKASDAPPSADRRDPANTTGGLSPAVVYLQNIKTELAELHKEMNALAKRVDDHLAEGSSRDEALIERLGELARAVESMKAAAPAPAAAPALEQPAPSPKKARQAEKAPEPEPEPLPEAVPEPKAELDSVPAELAAVTWAPAPAPEAPPAEKPRRGPVWPV